VMSLGGRTIHWIVRRPASPQSVFGASAAKLRRTRSCAGRCSTSRRVVLGGPRRRLTPAMAAARISRATRFLPTATPSARSSARMRGARVTCRGRRRGSSGSGASARRPPPPAPRRDGHARRSIRRPETFRTRAMVRIRTTARVARS
jgi:hypothetical protein